MMGSRRAAGRGATTRTVGVVAVALSAALAGVLGAVVFIAVRLARRVVTPAVRRPDTRIVDLDVAAQTITLTSTADTRLPGRYGLFTRGSAEYLKLGSVLDEGPAAVKRKLLTHVGLDARLDADASFSGWYFDGPDQLHLPYTSEFVRSTAGACPAWLFRAEEPSDVWVIQVHGRGTTRAECLRAVPLFHGLGITSLVVSYRNDGEAPRSRTGMYTLGATEWHDVEAAIGFARRRGATRVILMGWSMGGAIVLQVALSSAQRDLVAGIILESPVVDWRVVLDYQAHALRLPSLVTKLAVGALQSEWATPMTKTGSPIPFDRLDAVARAAELRHPVLILHSDDDGFVPSDASHALQQARPDLVDLEVFHDARHTKLWNYDQQRWSDAITRWLAGRGLTAPDAAGES